MERGLHSLAVKNFAILGDVEVQLGRLNVLVGPNGSGKTTLLRVVEFLGDAARTSLASAIASRGGYERIHTRVPTTARPRDPIRIDVRARVTSHAHEGALDEYGLEFRQVLFNPRGERPRIGYSQQESIKFKRTPKQGRRITLAGGKLSVHDGSKERTRTLDKEAFGLAVLPQLGEDEGAGEVRKIQELFTTFRVFDVDTRAARYASETRDASRLRDDAANLAAFLADMKARDSDRFDRLVADARAIVPGLADVQLRPVGGAAEAVVVDVVDQHLPGVTPLADASFGTVRALALLAMLYDPAPPLLTCVEEIDHGFHPHVFDRLVELLRIASQSTQLLIATHSPALVNRLKPSELIVCERDLATGLARMPAIDAADVEAMASDSPYGLGELWFSGTLGGVPK